MKSPVSQMSSSLMCKPFNILLLQDYATLIRMISLMNLITTFSFYYDLNIAWLIALLCWCIFFILMFVFSTAGQFAKYCQFGNLSQKKSFPVIVKNFIFNHIIQSFWWYDLNYLTAKIMESQPPVIYGKSKGSWESLTVLSSKMLPSHLDKSNLNY